MFPEGRCVFYQTIHAAGMKEKAKGKKRAKDFSPLREIGWLVVFLPIDSIPTDRFRPKGLKEIRYWRLFGISCRGEKSFARILMPQHNNRWSWQITAYRRFAKFGRKQCIRIRSIPSGLQPFATMRWWQMYNLSEVDDFIMWLRFLPDDSFLWHERKGE